MIVLLYIINFLGIAVISGILTFIIHTGIETNPYRPLCSYWFKHIFSYSTYYGDIRHYYQRLRYGISWDDAWNLDAHLAEVISKGLVHVRDSGLAPNLSSKDWDNMITGIKNYSHLSECFDLDCPLSHKQLEKDFNRGMMIFIKNYKHLWI